MLSNGWFKSVQYWCILLKYHFKDGGKVSRKVQPAFIIPDVQSQSKGWQIIHGQGRGDIVYFYLAKYIWTPSSYPPVLQPSSYLHLLPMIYDCSPTGIHSAPTDSEEWKISHFTSKYFQHGGQLKIFKATAPCKLACLIYNKTLFVFDVWWCLFCCLLQILLVLPP